MDSEVQKIYQTLLSQGKTAKDSAREAQQRTGFSVVTNQPIRAKQLKFTKEGVTYGQNAQLKKKPGKQGLSQF